jgi:hypothetical protein
VPEEVVSDRRLPDLCKSQYLREFAERH